LRQQRFGGQVERLGDQLEDTDGGLVQAALDLAQVGVGDARQLRKLAKREVGELALATV